MDPDVFLAMLRLAGEHSAEDLLPKIQAPVLVLAAERDTFPPADLAEKMAQAIPGADLFTAVEAGTVSFATLIHEEPGVPLGDAAQGAAPPEANWVIGVEDFPEPPVAS